MNLPGGRNGLGGMAVGRGPICGRSRSPLPSTPR